MLLSTRWLCAYWPVRKVARDGQQSGKLAKLFEKVAPWSPIRLSVRGMASIAADVWSSVITTTTFGCSTGPRLAAPAGSVAAASATSTALAPKTTCLSRRPKGGRLVA